MRILGVFPSYPPHSRVGSWLATHELLAHMAAIGHDVRVVVQLGLGRSYELDGIPVRIAAGHIEQQLPAVDVLVSHLGDTGRAHRAAVERGVPSVRMAHGGAITPDKLAGADLVVWNAESYRAGRPGIVVHPPVHGDAVRTEPGTAVTLVNLSIDKGVKTMWRAAELLPDVEFLAVRGATGRQKIPRALNVTVLDTVRDIRTVLARTRILLMPSAYETWGRIGVEAMHCGIPVIAHPAPGLVESLGAAGVFVDRAHPEAWARDIRRLLNPDEWAAASAAALARATELDPAPDLDRFAAALEELAA